MSEQVASTPDTPSDLLAVNDLDHFIVLLTDWHSRQVNTIKHLQAAPAGLMIVVGDGDEVKEYILADQFREGFQLGLDLALNYLGVLPFMAEYADEQPTKH